MTESSWRDAADAAMADMSRKWFGIEPRTRDRDPRPGPEHVERITAFARAKDDRYVRGELVIGWPLANRIVWQPFPQGSPRILTGPFRLMDSGGVGAGTAARAVVLETQGERLDLHILPVDLTRLGDALAGNSV